MFTSQVWVNGEMDLTREFITTNEFWDVEGLNTRLIKDSTFQTLETQVEVLSIEEEAI
jgi:hypothetical protein